MSRIAYVNGRYLPFEDAAVHIEDRGYQFGDGIYEVIYLHDGRFVDAELHLARLDRSLREIRLDPPMSRAALLTVLGEVARRNRRRNGLLYIQVTRGVAKREHVFPPAGTKPALVVTCRRAPDFPASIDTWTTKVITHPDERWARCDIKSTGLLPNILAKQAAREQGAGEAVLIDAEGMVTEGGSTSVWIVDAAGVLRVRRLDHSILPGCTRASLIDMLEGAKISLEVRAFSRDELFAAREAFITSASSFVKPIVAIDGKPVGDGKPGPVSRRLFDLFARHVQGNQIPSPAR